MLVSRSTPRRRTLFYGADIAAEIDAGAASDLHGLLATADARLYAVKRDGRNRTVGMA